MKRSMFSEKQILYEIRKAESGTPIGALCRQNGVSDATFYTWKKKYAYLGVSELRRLWQLEKENSRLQRLVANLSLDKQMRSGGPAKKSLRPARRRELAAWFHCTLQVSCVRASRLAQFGRAPWYRRSHAKDQSALRMRMRDPAHARLRSQTVPPGAGAWIFCMILRPMGACFGCSRSSITGIVKVPH